MSTALRIKDSEWRWTATKRKALDLYFKGIPKTRIAEHLGKHRNTINAWVVNPAFVAELEARLDEHKVGARHRRVNEVVVMTDAMSNFARKAIKDVEAEPTNPHALSRMQRLMSEYRSMRAQERTEFGEDVRRIEGHITGVVNHQHGIAKDSFAELLRRQANIIDVTAVENSKSPGEAIQAAVQSLLIEGEVLDTLHDEQKQEMAASLVGKK